MKRSAKTVLAVVLGVALVAAAGCRTFDRGMVSQVPLSGDGAVTLPG